MSLNKTTTKPLESIQESEETKDEKPIPITEEIKSDTNNVKNTKKMTKLKFHPKQKQKHKQKKQKQNHSKFNFPVDINYTPPRFDVNDPKAYEYLKQYGYLIIKDVLTQEECLKLRSETWDWLEKLKFSNNVKINRNDPETWHNKNWPADRRGGIVFSYGAGQTPVAWYIRDKERVKKAFGKIFNTSDLITSFDGFNLFRPWKYNSDWRTKGGWWHVDQNGFHRESSGFQCVQGLVPLLDCNPEHGGLSVIPKTHLKHDQLCKRICFPGGDFVRIPKTDKIFRQFNNGIMVNCFAGDLCLWDSRTIHCNVPSNLPDLNPKTGKSWKLEKKKNEWDLIRMTYYICMTPRSKATNKVLKQRQDAFKLHITSTHWPHKYKYRRGIGYVPHGDFKLNKSQLKLVGYPRGTMEELISKVKI